MADQKQNSEFNPTGSENTPVKDNFSTGSKASTVNSTDNISGGAEIRQPKSNVSSPTFQPTPGGLSKTDSLSTSSGGAATAPAKSFIDQAKATAGQAYDAVSEKAVTTLDEKKSTLTGGLSNVADTLRQAGDNLSGSSADDGLTGAAAKYTTTAAKKIEDAAQYFERNDIRSMMRDVEGFARRNPAFFLGAAFAAGVLVARFLKAEPSSYKSTGGSFAAGGATAAATSTRREFGQ